jgi:hypothetical protein
MLPANLQTSIVDLNERIGEFNRASDVEHGTSSLRRRDLVEIPQVPKVNTCRRTVHPQATCRAWSLKLHTHTPSLEQRPALRAYRC